MKYQRGDVSDGAIVLVVVFVICGLLLGAFFFFPMWNVWRMGLSGEASLERAKQTRQIQIEQAKAEKEAAQFRADAIGIIGKAAQDFPEYR